MALSESQCNGFSAVAGLLSSSAASSATLRHLCDLNRLSGVAFRLEDLSLLSAVSSCVAIVFDGVLGPPFDMKYCQSLSCVETEIQRCAAIPIQCLSSKALGVSPGSALALAIIV